MDGQKIHSQVIRAAQTQVELKAAMPGLYLLKLNEGPMEVYNQKILIQ